MYVFVCVCVCVYVCVYVYVCMVRLLALINGRELNKLRV